MRRDVLIPIVVLVAAAVAGYLWSWRGEGAAVPVASRSAEDERPEATAPQPEHSPGRVTVQTETKASPVSEDALTAKQAAALAAHYRRLAKFPRDSRPIDDGLDPIATRRSPKVERSGPQKEKTPVLVTFPSLTTYEAPGTVVIYAQVVEGETKEESKRHEGDPREPRIDARGIRGEVRTSAGAPVATLEFRDDGKAGDAEAGDRFFTATLTPDPDRPGAFRGQYLVQVTAETTSGEELRATTGFAYAVPSAHLTGQWRDAIVDGHLKVEAEVVVDEPGRYQLEATLASPAAVMMAHSRNTVTLASGTSWIPLTFWGLIFRERNVDGPYNLFSVVLSSPDEATAFVSDVVPAAHTTQPYKAADFSDQAYNDPDMLREAERYEALARAKAGS